MLQFLSLLRRFRREDRGVFAVFFALLALVLIATAGAVVDFTYVQEARTEAQTAMDAAALALQSRISVDNNATLISKAQSILTKQINDTSITATVTAVDTDATVGSIAIKARVTVPTAFIRMVGITTLQSNLLSEVTRGSKNVEVAVSLDITLSMQGTKIQNLIDATNDLIDDVVQTSQTPTYSKMAIIPWSMAANVDTYANNIRGTPVGPISISNVTWSSSTLDISNITKANPAVVTTATPHGLATGDKVYITGVSGMTQVNNKTYTVTWVSATTFRLNSTNSNSYGGYSGSANDKAYKCIVSSCRLVITTSSAHGLVANDRVYITGVNAPSSVNSSSRTSPGTVSSVVSSTQFELSGTTGPGSAAYTSGGTEQCLKYGCQWYRFTNAYGGTNTWQVTTCVSERTTNIATDVAPSTTPLGFVYDSNSGSVMDCPDATFVPLTSNKQVLHDKANSLTAQGSTAGHIGLAWGWYMISPNFAYLWPSASQPAAYNSNNLIKAVVLMTDGDFNTQYCNGVVSNDSMQGYNMGNNEINCAGTNGSSGSQFDDLCDAIKAQQNTILYTVGFDLAGNTTALNRLRDCATSTSYFFQANTGTDLSSAFSAIAQSLNNLRVSK